MRLRSILLLAGWLFSGTLASSPARAQNGCVTWALTRRSASLSCWAKLTWQTPGQESLCLPREIWEQALTAETPPSFCGEWRGKWSLYSPLRNETPGAPHLKETKQIFRVQALPAPRTTQTAMGARSIESCRWTIERARERIETWLSPVDGTGILRELVLGTEPPGGALELLSLLGFLHLCIASGLHLYALARIIEWGVKKTACTFTAISLPGARRTGAVLTGLVWLMAWLIAGARPGMLRPWLGLGLRWGMRRIGIRWQRGAPLILVLLIDTLMGAWRGEGFFSAGRLRYGLACAGGLLASTAPGMALGSWLAVAVFGALQSGTLALATPLLSLVSVPVFAGLIYPLLLIACAIQACGVRTVAGPLLAFCGGFTQRLVEGLTGLVMQVPLFWSVGSFAVLAGVGVGFLGAFFSGRAKTAVLAAILIFKLCLNEITFATTLTNPTGPRAERVEQLDVGQGDAALVVTRPSARAPTSFGLIDAGSERVLGDREWVELLAHRGVSRLDWIALTHLDEDHSGGVKRLGRLLPIGCVATARAEIESPRGQIYKHELDTLGIRLTDWAGGCVPYPTLAPRPPQAGRKNQNMGAVFIPLARGGFYLSAGDAEASDEPRIGAWARKLAQDLPGGTARSPGPLSPRILKLSHHGSKTSSNPVFLNQIEPTEAWISVGTGNRYGHPSVQVLREIEHDHVPLHRTDQEGALCAGNCGALTF